MPNSARIIEFINFRISAARTKYCSLNASQFGVDIQIQRGELTVEGQVIDEQGAAFADLDVLAYYSAPDEELASQAKYKIRYNMKDKIGYTVTDKQGRYRIEGLLRHNFKIQIGTKAARNGGLGKRLLARGIDLICVKPTHSDEATLRVATMTAQRSHTYQYSGFITLAGEQSGSRPLTLSDLKFESSFPIPNEPKLTGWGVQTRPFVEFDQRSGAFSFSCDTPRTEIRIRIISRGQAGKAQEITLYPQPDLIEDNVEIVF